jgi:hypothetical protein
VAATDLRRRIAYQESEWLRVTVGRPWALPYQGVPYLLARVDAIGRPGASGADAKVAAVEALLEGLDSLRDQVQHLGDDRDQLVRRFSRYAVLPSETGGWLAPLTTSSPLVGTTEQAAAAVKARTDAAATARATADAVAPVADELLELFRLLGRIGSGNERADLHERLAGKARELLAGSDAAAVAAVVTALPALRKEIETAAARAPVDEGR